MAFINEYKDIEVTKFKRKFFKYVQADDSKKAEIVKDIIDSSERYCDFVMEEYETLEDAIKNAQSHLGVKICEGNTYNFLFLEWVDIWSEDENGDFNLVDTIYPC